MKTEYWPISWQLHTQEFTADGPRYARYVELELFDEQPKITVYDHERGGRIVAGIRGSDRLWFRFNQSQAEIEAFLRTCQPLLDRIKAGHSSPQHRWDYAVFTYDAIEAYDELYYRAREYRTIPFPAFLTNLTAT